MADKPVIFISHISEEGSLAQLFKRAIEESFLNLVDVFVSSDDSSIGAGSNWLDRITEGLRTSQAMLIFCSPSSISRPWINFEAGAGWARAIEIVPMCHSGLRPVDLPLPLSLLQGIEAHDAAKIANIFKLIATKLGSKVPTFNATPLCADVINFERTYTVEIKAMAALAVMHKSWPELIREMKRIGAGTLAASGVPEWQVTSIRTSLESLHAEGLLSYNFTATGMSLGGGPVTGISGTLTIEISSGLNEVLQRRF
jgi:hypothetical protein